MKPRPSRVGATLLAPAFCALLLAAPAHAQIYYVVFKDAKTAKRWPTSCITLNGQTVLVGEAKSGITLANGTINYQGDKGNNELWAVNITDPSLCPYKLDGTTYVNANVKNGVASFTGGLVDKIQILQPKQSFWGLAREYALRKSQLDAAQKARDACKSGGPEWSSAHVRFLAEMERLQSWLDSTCYPDAAKKLAAELERQKKSVAKEAYAQRLASALASVAIVPTPARLVDLAKKLAPGTEFHVQESRHLRITYDTHLTDDTVKGLLELGEKMIDGFRTDFVDPYLGDDFKDLIPEERFMEIWFGPEEKNAHEHFLTDWYGVSWGDHKDERVAALSGRYRRNQPPEYLDYWKIADNKDFDAIVAHQLGHVLANLHYNAGRKADVPSWIEEGVGYWLALSWLGKNSVTCKQFEQQEYGKAAGPTIERAMLMGETELYTQVALEQGSPSDALLRKPLHQMTDADLAKAWSLFDWVQSQTGKKGQLWLRALCDVYAQAGPSLVQFREKSDAAFGAPGQDVFKQIDELWKKRAEEVQKSGTEPRKKQ